MTSATPGLSTKDYMYRDLLKRVAAEQARFGSSLQPPGTPEQLESLVQRAAAQLHAKLPAEFLEFLKITNGFDWNGVVIYASETVPIVGHPDRTIAGIVEMNLGYRDDERFEDLLVLGSNGMDLYTYGLDSNEYEVYDEVPHELIDSLPGFDVLMTRALTRSLQ